MDTANQCHLAYNPIGLPTLIVYDENGEILADVVRSLPEEMTPRRRLEEAVPKCVTTLAIGKASCGEGEGDFYEARITDTGEETRTCNLFEALKWVSEKTKAPCLAELF